MDETSAPIALITGATAGTGLAVAAELARKGWSIFGQYDGEQASSEQAADAITAAGAEAGFDTQLGLARADLTRSESREQLIEEMIDTFGGVDLLVNAAAGGPTEPEDLLELTEDGYQHVMDTRLGGPLFLTQLVANEMVRLVEAGLIERARIVTLNSISASATSCDHAAHCLARSALAMMTQLFADRLGDSGINCYEVRMGLISTGPGDPAHAQYDELIAQGVTPLRRWGRPSDVARAVSAIADGLLDFSTGEVICVDGGFHVRRL